MRNTIKRFLSCLLPSILALTACSGKGSPTPDGSQVSSPPSTPTTRSGAIWIPSPGTTWQWQLGGGEIDPNLNVPVYDVDLFETDPQLVATLHQGGKKVICYVSMGSWEDWRPDAAAFPPELLGKDYEGWAGEKWLDIRQIDKLAPILQKRLDLCRQKGFDAVEPDNIDGYQNETGFPLSAADQIKFNTWLANEAHARGLSIGLKNDSAQAAELLDHYDWAMTEDCFSQGWCEEMNGFIQKGKAVFQAEYTDTGVDFNKVCAAAKQTKFSPLLKKRDLDAWHQLCP